jgi:hypothetical protein
MLPLGRIWAVVVALVPLLGLLLAWERSFTLGEARGGNVSVKEPQEAKWVAASGRRRYDR